ncbi:MAG TPA: hypothetical protein PL151_14260 [Phycisphaerae bacterium]|nr:hypothetical protein [Phycisphaerae bacterium]HOJ75308.1 hypothetical protein [Phycisphaerae bacterium]HOM53027.1 hypothetical protein [Phycisphaerae bacterium]HON67536.1 hypothetical protein [Phycisphaerae bacterium]HOQ87208.1 hypothetical protein [Phycisphaerae bacterium]
MNWEQIGVIVGALSPLVGVPLVMITLYLRAIREHQTHSLAGVSHRIEQIEISIRDLLRSTADLDREFATKEEWVRESMLARQNLERLTQMVIRIQSELETGQNIAAELGRMTASILELAGRIAAVRAARDDRCDAPA